LKTLFIERLRSQTLRAALLVAVACGCGGSPEQAQPVTLNIIGSTTLSPIISSDAAAFHAMYPNVTINVTGIDDSGSTAAITGVGAGTVDVGMTSRDPLPEELLQYPDLVQIGIGLDAICIGVHASNPVRTLSLAQVRDIYSGKINNWNEVGGPDLTIKRYHRKAPSGTRDYFLEGVMKGVAVVGSATLTSSSGMKTALTNDPAAIGYGKSDGVPTKLALQTDDGLTVAPDALNIRTGAYPLNRPLFLVTRGTAQGAVKSFIEYALSNEGQRQISTAGLVPIR